MFFYQMSQFFFISSSIRTDKVDIKLSNVYGITSATGAAFLIFFKAYNQAHSKLCNCLYNAEDGQKDKFVVEVILFPFLTKEFLD